MEIYLTQIINYLLTQSWQIAALAVLIAMVSLALKNRSAHVRYLLWLIVLAKCLVPPLLTIPLPVLSQDKTPETTLISNAEMPAANVEMADMVTSEPIALPSLPVTSPTIMERLARVTARQWLGFGWIVGVAALLLFAVIKALRTDFWLWRQRRLLPAELQSGIGNLFPGLGFKTFPKVWLVEGIGQPFVWGLLRGSIYLPADFAKVDNAEHCRGVLGHELSHILRFDAAVNILQIIAQAIFWFHPFVWWANKKIRAEREKCCDEMAIARLGTKAKEYSSAIVNTLVAEYESTWPVPSLAIAGPVKNIEERIKTIMKPGKKFYRRPSLVAAVIVVILALVTVPTALMLTARAQTEAAPEQEDNRYASLYQAVKAGDLAEVKRLIAQGADLNALDKEGRLTPLGVAAAYESHTEIVKVLLDSGAQVDIAGPEGYSPLYYAILLHDEEKAKVLIASGANVNIASDNIDTPLNNAIWGDLIGTTRALLDAGANAELKDDKGMSPLQHALDIGIPDIVTLLVDTDDTVPDLHRAALKGDLSKLKELLGAGADINDKGAFGRTPIEYALAGGQSDTTKFLLSRGGDINLKPRRGNRSLLYQATRAGLLEIVQILIEKGSPVDTVYSLHDTALREAAERGHKEIAELLISKGAVVGSKYGSSDTPLHRAASMGHTDVVELLLAKGADINAPGALGRTPLDYASQNGHTELVNLLRQHGAKKTLHIAVATGDIDEVRRLITQGDNINSIARSVTPLHVAAGKGHKEIAELLIDKGADINPKIRNNVTALHSAVKHGHKDIVELLIAKGSEVNTKRYQGATALHDAVDLSRRDIVQLLIAGGADVNVTNDLGITPRYMAEQKGYTEILELLLKHGAKEISPSLFGAFAYGNIEQIKVLLLHGADVNARNNSGHTLLRVACARGNKELAEFLIDKGADVQVEDKRGWTPLHAASRVGNRDIVTLLIDKGADVQVEDKQGWTPLHRASMVGNRDIVTLLIDKGADVNVNRAVSPIVMWSTKETGGVTPLYLATLSGSKNVIELLISKGADVNARNYVGETALHRAAHDKSKDVVELLISKGADVDVKDNLGHTPIDMAEIKGRMEIVEILQKHGAKKGSPSLPVAVTSGNIEQVKLLISQGADINAKNESGQTPLLLALNSSRMKVAELLVEKGADVDATDGRTGKALLLSVGGRKERVELLLSKGANIEAKDGNGLTLLHLMAAYSNQKDYLDIVELLLEKGADIEARGHGDTTPLQTAVAVGRKKVAELLLAHGAKVDVMSNYWGTPAHHAMRENHPDLVRWCTAKGVEIPPMHQAAYFGEIGKVRSLLGARADVNQKDKAEFTPLHCAVFGRRREVVQLLMKNGADVKATSCGHTTPLFWACDRGYLDMVKLLVDNGAEVNGRAFRRMTWGPRLMDNWSNLHMAAHVGHVDVVEYLLVKGADINAKCTRGDGDLTPLHFAARKGHVNVVKVLLAKGADANLKSKEGRTALTLAKEKEHKEIVVLLRKHGAKE